MEMINSILLVDDECLFHLVFEDACSLLDITLNLESIDSADEAARLFDAWKSTPEKKPDCVFVDLNITNQKSWPFDFAALTLITVLNEKDSIGQIDPYKGKNTVKYGIEKDEKVGVELVYDFKAPPKEISILCKSTMRINADTVFFKQKF